MSASVGVCTCLPTWVRNRTKAGDCSRRRKKKNLQPSLQGGFLFCFVFLELHSKQQSQASSQGADMAKWDSCGSSPAFTEPRWMVRRQQMMRGWVRRREGDVCDSDRLWAGYMINQLWMALFCSTFIYYCCMKLVRLCSCDQQLLKLPLFSVLLTLFCLFWLHSRYSSPTRSKNSTSVPPRPAVALCRTPSHSPPQTATVQVWKHENTHAYLLKSDHMSLIYTRSYFWSQQHENYRPPRISLCAFSASAEP